MDKHPTHPAPETPPTAQVQGQPKNVFEYVNKYGTYNIQPTADAGNDYPAIAQGIPRAVREREQAAKPAHAPGTDPDPGHPYPKGKPRSDTKELF